MTRTAYQLTYLELLEAQSIHIIREISAEAENVALLFSGGKDSILMLHLARLAFSPARIPFTVLHIDTGHNFGEVLDFRDRSVAETGNHLLVASIPDMLADGRLREPVGGGSRNRLQSTALLDTVAAHGFDALLGGGRRDEEKARAKERIFSFRDEFGHWEPRSQRPELWNLYNGRVRPGEHMRVFPLSNWTELDVWQYVAERGIELPGLYFAHRRKVFERDGMLFAENPFLPLRDGEEVHEETVRFRTVGDMSCTGAVLSSARTAEDVVVELATSRVSERGATRSDDRFAESAMEDRKREGYF
jgi:sulfate adenylyltransferase subunit 2